MSMMSPFFKNTAPFPHGAFQSGFHSPLYKQSVSLITILNVGLTSIPFMELNVGLTSNSFLDLN